MTTQQNFLGIDPGASGGITVLDYTNTVFCYDMPKTEKAIFALLKAIQTKFTTDDGQIICFIEKVHAMPHDGVTSAFNFGYNFGVLNCCLRVLGIPFDTVQPKVWQKEFNLVKKTGSTTTQWKKVIQQKAVDLYPTLKMTLSASDSVLIALYSKRKNLLNK
jgi:crossover junction endodeoxyribonuclease RuvC